MKSTVEDALKRVFNPEFLNRIDDVIVFQPLVKEHIFQIIDVMAKDLFKRIEDLGLSLTFTDAAKDFLVEKGYDAQFGARPLRRAIQKYIEDPMAEAILMNEMNEGDALLVDYDAQEKADALLFKPKEPVAKKSRKSKKTDPASDAGTPGS